MSVAVHFDRVLVFSLVERLEHIFQVLLADSDTLIDHLNLPPTFRSLSRILNRRLVLTCFEGFHGDLNRRFLRRKFNRV